MITYHCDECGAEAPDGACPDHPKARVSSIMPGDLAALAIETSAARGRSSWLTLQQMRDSKTRLIDQCPWRVIVAPVR